MNALQRSVIILSYEWKRALAKKKVLALIVLALVFQILPFIIYSQFPGIFLTEEIKATMWLVGVLSGQSLFIQLVAIIVAGGSMSEEYEHGTADILLSKPITKVEYMIGKFFGGFTLLGFVELIVTVTGVILAYGFFGPQKEVYLIPLIFAAIVYSTLLFFSLTFMFSEVLRRSTIAMLTALGILIVSQIVGSFLSALYSLTGNQFYMDVSRWLPTWSATTLPTSVAADLMTLPSNGFMALPSGDVTLATIIVAIYTIIFVLLAYFRLVKSDVTKRTD